MPQESTQPRQSISDVEPVPFENVCTCKICDHGLARDCAKSGCICCNKEKDHSMVMDGIEGFFPSDRDEESHGK